MENFDPAIARTAVDFIHRTHSLDYAVELEREIFEKIMPPTNEAAGKPAATTAG